MAHYVVPSVGSGQSRATARRPKYFADGSLSMDVAYQASAIGQQWMVVIVVGLPTADHALLEAQPDVFVVPPDPHARLTDADVSAVGAKFDQVGLPTGWLSTALTWAEVLRGMYRMSALLTRFTSVHLQQQAAGGIVLTDATFRTALADQSSDAQAMLATAAASLGVEVGTLTGRESLKDLADRVRLT